MIYQNTELLGSAIVAVGTGLFKVASAGAEYYETQKAANEYNANMELINARNTADARTAERKAGYAENFAATFGNLDNEKTKRYLLIGAAIGVPLIAAFVFSKKKG